MQSLGATDGCSEDDPSKRAGALRRRSTRLGSRRLSSVHLRVPTVRQTKGRTVDGEAGAPYERLPSKMWREKRRPGGVSGSSSGECWFLRRHGQRHSRLFVPNCSYRSERSRALTCRAVPAIYSSLHRGEHTLIVLTYAAGFRRQRNRPRRKTSS